MTRIQWSSSGIHLHNTHRIRVNNLKRNGIPIDSYYCMSMNVREMTASRKQRAKPCISIHSQSLRFVFMGHSIFTFWHFFLVCC